jgi:hypothetical protein
MTTAIQDLAAKLRQSSLALDENGLGSKRVADALRKAFSEKVVLREATTTVSTDASLQFQAVAEWFLGVYRQPLRAMAFIHSGQLECVLIATLPQQWDFSWAYPNLPEYIDNSDPSGNAKPSFFSDLRFGTGLKTVFSSCDFRQGASAETIEAMKRFDPGIKWETVRQGLNFQGELDLATVPCMKLLCQFAGVTASLPVSGGLFHNKYDDEIRLDLRLSLDMKRFTEGLHFDVGVSSLVLSTSTSLFDHVPRSSARLLGHISFGESAENSYEVALFWPIGSKQLILSNVGPIPFPGLDIFLPETNLSHEPLKGLLKDRSNDFQIREIALGVSWDPLSITSLWCSVGSPQGWNVSLLPDDLKNILSIEEYVLRFDLKPHVEVSAHAAFMIGGGRVHLSGVYPDLIFSGSLAPSQEIDVSALLGVFLPAGAGNRNSELASSSLKILDLEVEADFKQHIYSFDLEIATTWEISIGGDKALALPRLRLSLEKEADWTSVSLDSVVTIAGVDLYLSASHAGGAGTSEWAFYGKTGLDKEIPFKSLMKDLATYIGGDGSSFPKVLQSFVVRNLRAEFHVGGQSEQEAKFHCEGEWSVATHGGGSLLVDLSLTVTRKTDQGARVTTFDGTLTIGDLDFTFAFLDEQTIASASDLLVATYSHKSGQQKLKLGELLGSVVQGDTDLTRALDSVEIDLKDALFGFSKLGEEKKFLFGFDVGAELSLKKLPLVGKEFSADSNVSIDNLQVTAAWKPFTVNEVRRLNSLIPSGVNKLPEATKTSADAGSGAAEHENGDSDSASAIALREGLNIGARLNLGNISRPLALPAAGPPGTLPEEVTGPGPSTDHIDTAETGGTPAVTTADNTSWLKIQKSLGPVHFERIGVLYKDAAVWFLLDATLTAAGLTLSLDGLFVGSPLNKFEPRFDLRGLGIDYRNDALEIGGAFLKVADNEYAGAAVIKARHLTLSALGLYKEMPDGHPSVFVYAVLDYPLGGPAFFFVTGLAAGFGYSRALKIPTIDKVESFSLVENARRGAGMPENILTELNKLKDDITPAAGENFLAVGVKFTSFKIVDSFALLTVSFGNHFEMNLLGLSTLIAPPNAGAGVPPVAEAKLALKASFQPDKGFLGVQAQLTPGSYLLSKDCHLTGGFAFYCWFAGSEHDGDFALTLGGYHPHFRVPEHYPTVPRLGFNWQVSPELSLKGDAYFALTASALMAGGHLEANWRSGSVHAWFKLGADFLIAWQPYHYEIDAYVDMGVDVTFEFFGTQHISVDVGTDLKIWGPEFSGEATIHLWIISFTVKFGAAPHSPAPIDWPKFKTSFLPADKDVCAVAVNGGLVGKDSKDAAHLGVINPRHFSLATNSVVPSTAGQYASKDAKHAIPLGRTAGRFGIAPLGVAATDLTSTQTITIKRKGEEVGNEFDYSPIFKKVPTGQWGELVTPVLNGNQFVENALSGFNIRPRNDCLPGQAAAIPRSKLQGAVSGETAEYRWAAVKTFAAVSFDSEQKRRDELRRTLAAGAAVRSAVLKGLGFMPEDVGRIALEERLVDDFLVAPQIERSGGV